MIAVAMKLDIIGRKKTIFLMKMIAMEDQSLLTKDAKHTWKRIQIIMRMNRIFLRNLILKPNTMEKCMPGE